MGGMAGLVSEADEQVGQDIHPKTGEDKYNFLEIAINLYIVSTIKSIRNC